MLTAQAPGKDCNEPQVRTRPSFHFSAASVEYWSPATRRPVEPDVIPAPGNTSTSPAECHLNGTFPAEATSTHGIAKSVDGGVDSQLLDVSHTHFRGAVLLYRWHDVGVEAKAGEMRPLRGTYNSSMTRALLMRLETFTSPRISWANGVYTFERG